MKIKFLKDYLNDKKFIPISALIMSLSFVSGAQASNVSFEAGDNSAETKLCILAASNNLAATKHYISRIARSEGLRKGNQVAFLTKNLTCNDTDIVKFAATYNAGKTFKYLNRRAYKEHRLDTDTSISDLAKTFDKPTLIVVTSK